MLKLGMTMLTAMALIGLHEAGDRYTEPQGWQPMYRSGNIIINAIPAPARSSKIDTRRAPDRDRVDGAFK